jgi:hypothetical protein
MEEDWYSMEWVLAERKRELAARETWVSRFRSPGRDVQRLTTGTPEKRCWRGIGGVATVGAVALLGAIAPGSKRVNGPSIAKHWRHPGGHESSRGGSKQSEPVSAQGPSGTPFSGDRGDNGTHSRHSIEAAGTLGQYGLSDVRNTMGQK